MFENVEEVRGNKYINNLIEECVGFKLAGAYIKKTNAKNPENNGLYYICGFKRSDITDKNLDIEKLYDEQQKNPDIIRLDIHIEKLKDCSPFAVHENVMKYCQNASVMMALMNKYEVNQKIEYLSKSFILKCKELYKNSLTTQKLVSRSPYDVALENFIHEKLPMEIVNKGRIEATLPESKDEKVDKKKPYMVSINRLYDVCPYGTKQINIDYNSTLRLSSGLNAAKIFYSQCVPFMTDKLELNSDGDVVKNGQTVSVVRFMYDANREKDVEALYIKTKCKNMPFQNSVEDIKKIDGTICSFGLPLYLIDTVFEEANNRGIKLCIDKDKLFYGSSNPNYNDNTFGNSIYTVSLSKRDTCELDDILKAIANRSAKTLVLCPDDIARYCKCPPAYLDNQNVDYKHIENDER